jgi:DnaJ-class molecular chaperone
MSLDLSNIKRVNDLPEAIGGSLMCKCQKCSGTGYGESYMDVHGELDVHPCSDCGGWGDKAKYQQWLHDKWVRAE